MALETPGMRARPTRPDPAHAEKRGAVVAQAAAVRAAGGEAWVGDETAVRAFPPLRAAWSNRGAQAVVAVSGRNAPRTSYGALQVASGEPVDLARERARTADAVALAETVGAVRPGVPRLLVWDNAPSHHPTAVKQAAQDAGVALVFLPFRSPELMPREASWRGLEVGIAANRAYPTMDELAERTRASLDGMAKDHRLRRRGLRSSTLGWPSAWPVQYVAEDRLASLRLRDATRRDATCED